MRREASLTQLSRRNTLPQGNGYYATLEIFSVIIPQIHIYFSDSFNF